MIVGSSQAFETQQLGSRFRAPFPRTSDRSQAGAQIFLADWGVAGLDALDRSASNSSGSWLVFSGNPFFLDRRPSSRAQALLELLEAGGADALAAVDGAFAIAWWSSSRRRLMLIRDRFGMEPLYYTQRSGGVIFGSRIRDLARIDGRAFELSAQGLVEFLTYCFIPGNATLDQDVWRVAPAHALMFDAGAGTVSQTRWYHLSYRNPTQASEAEITTEYRNLLERAVTRRLGTSPAGAFLSGGMDSSSVVTFMRRHLQGEIKTFGFRCAGNSFDESHYARSLAAELGTVHSEVNYAESDSLGVVQSLDEMEVPFCDIGIEVGTWLLGRTAGEQVDYLLTGDGGDELWASHPIYAAQKMVAIYDRLPIPKVFKRSLQSLTNLVHDTDRKRNMAVIIKRLLPAVDLPVALGPFRWRVYYTPQQLQELLSPAMAERSKNIDAFASVMAGYEGYDGPDDGMSAHLYNDYFTASGFYFSRLQLIRKFGLEVRLPFYDRELVEFGARIPAHLKLEGIEKTKRLFRVAMEGVLPDIVNHRKDKLGHSVPLKNWLRGDGVLGEGVRTELRDATSELTGILRPELLARWLGEHDQRRHNHSHRLWAAFVLGQWLKSRRARESVRD